MAVALPAASGQTAADLWQDVNDATLLAARRAVTSERTVVPGRGRALRLTRATLDKVLAEAPAEFSGEPGREFPLPMPDGTFARFALEESPLMEPKLAAKFPELKTYVARGIDDPSWSARFDVTPQGFHAVVLAPDGVSFYVDPYWRDDTTHYLAYRRRDYVNAAKTLTCAIPGRADAALALFRDAVAARPTGATLRTYRLAVACTGEYAAAAGGGTVLGSLGAILTTVNRVSALYERDLAIRLKLVNGEDQIIFTNAVTDGYTNTDGDAMLDENQAKIDAVIGTANYDIGHVFSTGGGGIAGLGVVGNAARKANGVTGSSNPVGDPFDIDYVAHEMGHQFGANHPFNATTGSCSASNRNGPTAYEPGSGTTIMAYAGICSPQDLAAHSDDYFHTINYDEIDAYTSTSPGNVGVSTATGNTAPTVGALTSRTIPMQTPFALTATATDPDAGDVLTYCWEEFDKGAAQDPTASPRDNGSSPIFRSFDPTTSPTRIFPSLTYILNNANVPPATVSGYASGEFLPTTSRTMTFRCTVRDNRLAGGGSNYGSMTVTSTTAAGPFAITSHNSAATIAGGSSQTVTWSVAGTTAAPVSCANVKISLSTDGGYTFPFVLAASTPNDGSQAVTIPNVGNVATTQGRIKVEAVGNIFFDVSNADLTITSTNTAPTLNVTGGVTVQRGTPTPVVATVATASDVNTPLTATISNAPADTTLTASISGTNVNVSALADCSLVTTNTSRTYPFTLTVTDAIGSATSATVNLVVQPNVTPTVGTYPNVALARSSSATATPSAAPADANGNLGAAPVSISLTTLPGGGTLSVNQTTGAVTATTTAGTTLGTYPITVTVQDSCGAAVVRSFNVVVGNLTPTIVAGTASAPTAENCVPANGAVDPAETVTVNFSLNNTGTGPTTNLAATLQASGGVTPVTTTQNYGVIAAGGTAARAFTFTASGAAACGSTITATFQLQDGAGNLGTVALPIRLGALQSSSGTVQNFDAVTAPALPSGWTATVPTGTATAWRTAATTPDTAPNSVFANSTAAVSETRLESPNIAVSGGAAQIVFRHRWNLESGYDGGVLEISIGGGTFADVLAAGGSFATGGYNGTISASFSSVLGGRQAWTGSFDSAYTTTTVNLPSAAAGQNVRLRFRLASDDGVNVAGNVWRVDSIALVTSDYACCGAPPAITSSAPPVGRVNTAYSHAFTTSGTPPPTFTLSAGTLPPGLTLGAGGTLSGTPTTVGIYPGISVAAANGLAPAGAQSFTLTIGETYPHYIAAFGFNAAGADAEADPDGDGIKNLAEYGLHLAPNVATRSGLPQVTRKTYAGSDYLSMTFTRLSSASDLLYEVQVSPDLVTWTTVASSSGGAVPSGAGFVGETGPAPVFTVEARDTTPLSPVPNRKRYIRLQITKLP